jgi:SAM-dependent methyltransferase
VPLVTELIHPGSVVDLGCGSGAWLSVFQENDVEDIYGLDGDWVDREMLFIPTDRFATINLNEPVRLDRRFDLVVSLEVAEHIPAENAGLFVHSLTALAPVVLFSAAIPGQGGTHHVNEQWPDYWVRLFAERGYAVIDCLRKKVWDNDRVEWWYAQNLLLFVRLEQVDRYPLLRRELDTTVPAQLALVHPQQYLAARDPENMDVLALLAALPNVIGGKVRRRLASWFGRDTRCLES